MAKPHRANHHCKVKNSTERSEHLNTGSSPALEGLRSKFLVRLRSQEMGRASIGVSLPSGADK